VFGAQLLPASYRQPVVLGAAVIVGYAPFALEQASALEAKQCRIERPLLDQQCTSGDLRDPKKDGVSVEWTQGHGLQDQ
jgi:hypothetical protein